MSFLLIRGLCVIMRLQVFQACGSESYQAIRMSNLAQPNSRTLSLRKCGLKAKLWPNGEISIYRPHRQVEAAMNTNPVVSLSLLRDSCVRACGVSGTLAVFDRLGLSHPRNFDKKMTTQAQRGLKGITSLGKRRVRNAAYMLTRENGKHRLTFATVTLPALTGDQMSRVHKEWHRCIDFYRREVRRVLVSAGLTGEIVGVTEVQEKRYATSGLPILHAHFVFCGASRSGGWALCPTRHDFIWKKSIEHVLGESIGSLPAACQLKSVTASAEAYLGKYMSKGAKAVQGVLRNGFGAWLPKQWWNCSRSLSKRMDAAIASFESGSGWLVNRAADPDCDLFCFFNEIVVEKPDGASLHMGYFGRLTPKANSLVRRVLSL